MRVTKKGMRRTLVFMMVFVMAFSQTAYATSIKKVQSEKEKLEDKKTELDKSIQDLEKDKDDIVAYIEKLDKKLNELNAEIATMKTKISAANGNLTQIKSDLEKAEESANNQYDTMKKRIKYMYENGSQDYIEILLHSDSIGDLLNRVEYINKINKYDNNLLDKYESTKNLISKKKKEQEQQIAELKSLEDELSMEQDSVETLSVKKTEQLKKKNTAIRNSKNKSQEYEKAIEKQEKLLEDLLEQERKRKEEELKRQEEELAQQNQGTNSGTITSPEWNAGVGTLRWPLNINAPITSPFGYRDAPTAGASTYHKGIDLGIPTGTPIVSSGSGTVVTASYQFAAGNYVMIYHGNSTYTVYMHLSSIRVSVGQKVSQGELIGLSGNTGVSTGPHLHFGVNINGTYVNPLNYIKRP